MSTNLIAPVMALVLWTLIVLFWMVFVRIAAVRKSGINMTARAGGRGQNLEGVLPDKSNWPAHNYMHLLEQPTLFYATVLGLALMGQGNSLNVALAWTYVAVRILHSLWQGTVNTIPVRLALFVASTLALIALAIHGLMAALHGG